MYRVPARARATVIFVHGKLLLLYADSVDETLLK